MKAKLGGAAVLIAALSSCGSSVSCSTNDVLDTLRELLADATTDQDGKSVLSNGEATAIVTRAVDESTGFRRCKADFTISGRDNGEKISKEISYEIALVDSKDAEFEVYADRDSIYLWASEATSLARGERRSARATDLRKSLRKYPPVPLTAQEVAELISGPGGPASGRDIVENSIKIESFDFDNDGVSEYLAYWRYESDGYARWNVMPLRQSPAAPGKKMELRKAAGDPGISGYSYGNAPIAYRFDPSSSPAMVFTLADGSEDSLYLYGGSRDSFNNYISERLGD